MNYYSTKNKNNTVGLKEAIFKGLPDDGGLFMPMVIPVMEKAFIHSIKKLSLQEISFELSKKLFGDDIPSQKLKEIVDEALNFEIPLIRVCDHIHSLELFHGPTLAFKDVGARFMARILSHFIAENENDIHVLVATSGDTGSAVANGFLGVEGITVHVLYPKNKVSKMQEKQFATLGQNIRAIEVEGNFDDCQRLVKTAFNDKDMEGAVSLTSANSINLARLLPQSFYYWHGWKQLANNENTVFCVPSGNFGNLTAGLIAQRMGLPAKHFIAATNINDIVPNYLIKGKYEPRASVSTIANAMDVGDPSNFSRMLDLFDSSQEKMAGSISAFSYKDEEIRASIKKVYKDYNYILDPHGAIGFKASQEYLKNNPENEIIFFETAHPAKFAENVAPEINRQPEIPQRLKLFLSREKSSIPLSNNYKDFKEYLKTLA
ncbi:MAG: threonine synthase [Bacteroidales bacterium]|nr:threonine synthase [Bacteroidales bacterium]MCF8389720.1 threonine synthase [Bacteroidales bacterium]